ncbi:MAG: hypothetical protein ACO3B7_03635 [Candidatus Limnocylindrus sp.]
MPLTVLVNLRGNPEPPTDVVRRLRAVDPNLGLEWSAFEQWRLVRKWAETDRRWQWVQEGKTPPSSAHDVIGYIPNDCDVDQVPAYVAQLLRDWPVAEAREMLSKMDHYHTEEATAPVAQAMEEAVEQTMADVTAPLKKTGRRKKVTLAE